MASNVPVFRLVRCPNCRSLVAEFANVPVYQCAVCDTVLRAKYSIGSGENVTSRMIETSSMAPDIGSSGSELDSSGQELMSSSLKVNNGAPNGFVEDNASTSSKEKGESSKHTVDVTEGIDYNGDTHRIETETNSIEEMEKPLKVSDKMVESAKPVSHLVTSEDMVDRELGHTHCDSFRSPVVGSHAYDGNDSFDDDRCNNVSLNKYLTLPKATGKKVVDTTNFKGKSPRFINEGTDDLSSQFQYRSSPAKSSNERDTSTPTSSSDSDRAELSSSYGFDPLERESSFDSDDFHSVQNWMEPQKVALWKSMSRESVVSTDTKSRRSDTQAKLISIRPDHMKILRKVDELRDELSELFDQAVKRKQKSRLRSIREEELTPTLNRKMQYTTKSIDPQLHNDSIPPIHFNKTLADENVLKKPRNEERKQPVRRHCRPVAGGAPIVICSKCLELLQIPADFLVSRRRFHKLRCGSCSEILLYSFRSRVPKVSQKSAGEFDNSTITRNELPDSHSSNGIQDERINFSDDYVLSFARSDSVNRETVLHVSRSSSYQIEELIDKQAEGPSLHRLLGYASASEILYRFSDSDRGYCSTEPATPRFYVPSEEIDSRDGIRGMEIQSLQPRFYVHSEEIDARDSIGGTEIRPLDEDSDDRLPSNFIETSEEEISHRRLRNRRVAPPLRVWLKKGMRELNHGLEKLKIQSHVKTIQS